MTLFSYIRVCTTENEELEEERRRICKKIKKKVQSKTPSSKNYPRKFWKLKRKFTEIDGERRML